MQKVTDGRGAATNYAYNNRHLLTDVTYTVPQNSPIPVPGAINFQYDAAANRTLMTDATGTTTYSYDSLSRMNSESRTFTGLSGSYALNYSYNLADALTVLSIPFRSQQIGYSYDIANRPSGVSASGFSATSNQSTQSLSSFVSSIAYRAWGGRKSMTYGNTTSEETAYNSRLLPTTYTLNNMNYQNATVCCPSPTYSTMTWSYGYYNDGALEHAWDSTNEWFDRAYKYDHVGRPKEASTYRRAQGLNPYPAVSNPDPYFQSISYDVWNHSSRTGKLYTGEPSDMATYVNNRRADHSYDADGNTTNNGSYNQTIDAAGMLNHSVSIATVGDGLQYPFEPRLDITQTYDGTGTPVKRNQITRYPGIFDEFGNQGEPVEDTKTTYSLTSSVLGGAVVVELASGWTDTVYIYAGRQRIAREEWGSVSFEHHNPVTGSWVTSNGHSSYRTTTREERDPRGAEVPLANPYPAAHSYVDWKSTQPLFIEGGDPFDYTSGRTIDGLPVSEAEFQRRTGGGSVTMQKTDARGNVYTAGNMINFGSTVWVDEWQLQYSVSQSDFLMDIGPNGSVSFPQERGPIVTTTATNLGYFITASNGLSSANYLTPRSPQKAKPLTGAQIDKLGSNLQKFLDDPECGNYIKALLGSLPNDVRRTNKYGGSLMDNFNRIKNGGGFWSGDTISKKALAITNPNTMMITFDSQRSTPLITGQSWQQFGATTFLAHELIHVFTSAPNAGVYDHLPMAQAASAAASSLDLDVKGALGLDFPTTQKYGTGDDYDLALSNYHDRVLAYACRKVKL